MLVADFWNASVSEAADDEAKVMTFESRYASPAMDRVFPGVEVPIPSREFVMSVVRKLAESMEPIPE